MEEFPTRYNEKTGRQLGREAKGDPYQQQEGHIISWILAEEHDNNILPHTFQKVKSVFFRLGMVGYFLFPNVGNKTVVSIEECIRKESKKPLMLLTSFIIIEREYKFYCSIIHQQCL